MNGCLVMNNLNNIMMNGFWVMNHGFMSDFDVSNPVFIASDSNMVIMFKVFRAVMMETDWMSDDFLDVAHALHLFEKMSDFLFDLSQVVDLLNESLNSVVGLISDSEAFCLQVLDPM